MQASTGFGYALVAMSLLPLFLPMAMSSAISAVTVVLIGLQMSLTLRKHLDLRVVALPIASCVATIGVGIWLLSSFSELLLRLILAGLLLVVTAVFVLMRRRRFSLPARWYTALGAGLITGVSTGMFNIVGPFLMLYYLSACEDTLRLKASLEFSFLVAGLYASAMHLLVTHSINAQMLPYLLGSAVAVFFANRLGLRLYYRIDRDRIVRYMTYLLPVMAALLIWRGLS